MTGKYSTFIVLLVVFPVLSYGQMAETDSPIKTTLCEMYKHPEQYAGKRVEVRARVVGDFFRIDDLQQKACAAWTQVIVVYPKQVKPAPGFDFVQDDSIKKLIENVRTGKGVEATFEGRFDVAFVWRDHKKVVLGVDKGYGKKNQYGGRMVLHKLSDVVILPGSRL